MMDIRGEKLTEPNTMSSSRYIVAIFEGLEVADAYLVCRYKGTNKTITIHAPDATFCKALIHPDVVFCD
jgi:hypothetical protein